MRNKEQEESKAAVERFTDFLPWAFAREIKQDFRTEFWPLVEKNLHILTWQSHIWFQKEIFIAL